MPDIGYGNLLYSMLLDFKLREVSLDYNFYSFPEAWSSTLLIIAWNLASFKSCVNLLQTWMLSLPLLIFLFVCFVF